MDDERLTEDSVAYVKANYKKLIKHLVGDVLPVSKPVSIFMAGSPGAGKTEFSTHLINEILGAKDKIVRIDPDEIRLWLPQYVPGKAEVFQKAVTVGVNKVHDYVKAKSYSFLLDGTFSNLDKARNNIKLSLDKDRPVLIQYVVQPPQIAWNFTKDRERVDGRNIRKEDFVQQFLSARDCVIQIKKEFGNHINVDLIERNLSTGEYQVTFNIDNIDKCLPRKYSKDDIEKLI
jgi:UDP-N-acetylglucosamine kinase